MTLFWIEMPACMGKGWISSTFVSQPSAYFVRIVRAGLPVYARVRIVESSRASTIAWR